MKSRLLLVGFLAALYLACGSDGNSDTLSSPGSSPTCIAGKVEACACPGSSTKGTQTCQPDGTFSACSGCPSSAGGSGGSGSGGKGGQGGKGGASAGANQGGSSGAGGVSSGNGGADPAGSGGEGGQNTSGQAGASNGGASSGGSSAGGAVGGTSNGGTSPGGSDAGGVGQGGSSSGASGTAGSAGNDDKDKDGWTIDQGDCDDSNPAVNPGAIELVDTDPSGKPLPLLQQLDNDCDGKVLQPGASASCDTNLGPLLIDPFDAARAIGLCSVKVDENSKKWGVISAVLSDIGSPPLSGDIKAQGKAQEHAFGLLPGFGDTSPPREGQRLFAISSGIARVPGQPGWGEADVCSYAKNYTSGYPNGFPKNGTCGTTGTPNDGVAVDFKIRVPSNAKSLKFKYRFFSCEYPQYTCSTYNDVFAVLLSPSPLKPGDPMADAQNLSADIAFEQDPVTGIREVIGVNNESFLTACEPGAASGVYPNCKAGNGAQLKGSGFEGHAASSWLVNQANVPPGEIIYLRIAIWDSADGILDSTAILDAFEWSTQSVDGATNSTDNTGGTGGTGSSGSGGGGQGGSTSGIFGGSGGAAGDTSGLFGGSGGSTSTAGSSSGGNGSGGGSGVPGPCPDGSCAGPGQCCLNPGPPAQCGQDFGGIFCL